MALGARHALWEPIIFMALILVVACSLLYWLSALCGDYSHPKRDGNAALTISIKCAASQASYHKPFGLFVGVGSSGNLGVEPEPT